MIVPLKSMRSLQSFSNRFRVVNNQGDTVSVQSMTRVTWCSRSQRLLQHVSIIKSIKIHLLLPVLLSLVFFFFQSKIIYSVLAQSLTTWTRYRPSQRPSGHGVRVVIDQTDIVPAQSMTMLIPCQHVNFCKYLRQNKKFHKTVVTSSFGTQVKFLTILFFRGSLGP